MANLLASWLNDNYSKLSGSIGVTRAINTGISARNVTAKTSPATATSINNLINDINGLRSNVFLRHATSWSNPPRATTAKTTPIDEDLKNSIDSLVAEFEKMCGNNAAYNAHTQQAYYTGNGFYYSYSTGNGQSYNSGNGVRTGNGQGSWECCYASSNDFHTCTNFFTESTTSNSTTSSRTSNNTKRTSYSDSTSSIAFSLTQRTFYNFSVLSNSGSVSNANATQN